MSQIIDAVKAVLEKEVASEQFFWCAARLTERDDSRMVFLELAELEQRHVHSLAKSVDRSHLNGGFCATTFVERLEDTPTTPLSADDSIAIGIGDVQTAIRAAEVREIDLRDQFLFLSRALEDTGLKVLYDRLSQLEDEHVDELKRLAMSLDMAESERPCL